MIVFPAAKGLSRYQPFAGLRRRVHPGVLVISLGSRGAAAPASSGSRRDDLGCASNGRYPLAFGVG